MRIYNLTLLLVVMNEKAFAGQKHGMDTPVDVELEISSQEHVQRPPLGDGVAKGHHEDVKSVIAEKDLTPPNDDLQGQDVRNEEKDGASSEQIVSNQSMAQGHSASSLDFLDHSPQLSANQSADNLQSPEPVPNASVLHENGQSDYTEQQTINSATEPVQTEEGAGGQGTPISDGTATPPTPRSTPAKPSVFKKTASLQKISLNKDFLKNVTPSSSGSQPMSTTPRPLATDKGISSATKALKPMVRNRLSNMGGTSMQRQGSGSSTPKSGRGSSPNFGRPGAGSDVWSWRRQPVAAREYSEEELQRQGVHLTARLTASTGDDANKWADMDDDWSEEEVDESKASFGSPGVPSQETGGDEPSIPIAPHLLESAAMGPLADKSEETMVVSKNERFADVTYDRRGTRSPDDNIHGQRQIYNPKLGRFEDVQPQAGREQERHTRRNVEIMQRNQGRRGSSAGGRRDSFARSEESKQSRISQPDNRTFSTTSQRRTSFAERDLANALVHRRRDSFLSTSGISDADRSVSNASPGLENVPTGDQLNPLDLIALQQKEMAESRKRALERRAKDEEERIAAAERARKKADELAMKASPEVHAKLSTTPIASPIPSKASPVPPDASPAIAADQSNVKADEPHPKPGMLRSDSGVWTSNRDQEEIIRKDSPSKEEVLPKRSAWGAIGSSQPGSNKHQQNGLFTNPNTLAAINHTIGGDAPRRGRNAPKAARAPINPTNVPASLQGWAAFAGNSEARKAHDNERQQERNRERERIDKEKTTEGPRVTSLVDKWKKVEIKEPENVGDVAGRTVVSVLKSGYMEDSAGNLEVKQLPIPNQNQRPEAVGNSGLSNIGPSEVTTPLIGSKSPVMGSPSSGLVLQTPTQGVIGDKTPSSRDRSRFFPSPSSTVVDLSPRVVHPIQPSQPDKSVFPPSIFSSFDDLGKSSSVSNTPISPMSNSVVPTPQLHPTPQRQYLPSFSHLAQTPQSSSGQPPATPQIGGLTPRNAFSHTVPMKMSSPPPPSSLKFVTKMPTARDFDQVMERIRQTIQTSNQETTGLSPTKEPMAPTQHENVHQLNLSPSVEPQSLPNTEEPLTQTRNDNDPVERSPQKFFRISAISSHRDLEISTRDVDEEPLPKTAVKVSLPQQFYSSSRDMDIPIETSARPKINLPKDVISHTDTPDAKTRIEAIDRKLPQTLQRTPNRHPHAFKIQFSPSLRPTGGVVPNLIKRDKNGLPYVNYEAKSEALALPAYGNDNEVFYANRDKPFSKQKHHKFNKHNAQSRKSFKSERTAAEGSSSGQSSKSVTGSAHQPEKK